MNSDDDILGHRTLPELEDAERRLRAHIKKRKTLFRPSTPRRIIGLFLSIPMIAFGLFIVGRALEAGYLLGLPIVGGGALAIGGAMWIYCDWFE